MTRMLLAGWIVAVGVLGAGCKTMATRDTGTDERSATPPPGMGGAGLDPNPDHNVVNGPGVGP
ncbi:hypothetical protein [Archangium primigenium]|jgi:hypothetical protein|uniref:hypothetical protein n=1 Tax=[Archangium] primigenium TaxID=2792470 RepID=UPI00195C2085|nr:hypothetical protein [Archangium primigenium]MBM7117487.1 hypothetical protein [Archangium primigenium]